MTLKKYWGDSTLPLQESTQGTFFDLKKNDTCESDISNKVCLRFIHVFLIKSHAI